MSDGDEWLSSLDRFGIVSDRAVLLEGATLVQNLALPFTLEIDPVTDETRERVTRLAEECDIAPEWLEQPAAELPAGVRARAHLVRALALGPELLLMEHPSAALAEADRAALGQSFSARARRARYDADDFDGCAILGGRRAPCADTGACDRGSEEPWPQGLVQVLTRRSRFTAKAGLLLAVDDAAGDPRAAADARLGRAGHTLVGIAVNDDGAAVRIEQRQRASESVTRVVTP